MELHASCVTSCAVPTADKSNHSHASYMSPYVPPQKNLPLSIRATHNTRKQVLIQLSLTNPHDVLCQLKCTVEPGAGDHNGPPGDPAAPQTPTAWTTLLMMMRFALPLRSCRGGWTKIIGSEASEPEDLSTDRKMQILSTPDVCIWGFHWE